MSDISTTGFIGISGHLVETVVNACMPIEATYKDMPLDDTFLLHYDTGCLKSIYSQK